MPGENRITYCYKANDSTSINAEFTINSLDIINNFKLLLIMVNTR